MADDIPADVMKAMAETYDLEIGFTGLNKDAAAAALQTGLGKYEERMLTSIAKEAEMYAAECDESDDYRAALLYFANKLRQRLPVTLRGTWQPQTGDVVEITLMGPIEVFGDPCGHCGMDQTSAQFSIFDDHLDKELFFEAGDERHIMVRLLHREGTSGI